MADSESLNPKFLFTIEGRNKIQNLFLSWEKDCYEVSKNTLILDKNNSGEVTPPSSWDRILIYTKGENTTGIDTLFTINGQSVAIQVLDFFSFTTTENVISKIQFATDSDTEIETVIHFFKNK